MDNTQIEQTKEIIDDKIREKEIFLLGFLHSLIKEQQQADANDSERSL